METTYASADIYTHVRIVMGMVVGLGITRLLAGLAGIVQHASARARASLLHLLWVGSMLVELVLFWWWEFALFKMAAQDWTFAVYFAIVVYAINLYLICALLFPDKLDDYPDYESFFLSRRRWFFSLLALTFVLDLLDTLIKGPAHAASLGMNYMIQLPIGVALCVLGMATARRDVHLGIVGVHIAYQVYQVVRLFSIS